MRRACAITLTAYRAVFASLTEGLTVAQVSGWVETAHRRLGVRGGALVLFGPDAAYPHGTRSPRRWRRRRGAHRRRQPGARLPERRHAHGGLRRATDGTAAAPLGPGAAGPGGAFEAAGPAWSARRWTRRPARRSRTPASARLPVLHPPPRPRHRPRRPRVALHGARQRDEAGRRRDVHRRAGIYVRARWASGTKTPSSSPRTAARTSRRSGRARRRSRRWCEESWLRSESGPPPARVRSAARARA